MPPDAIAKSDGEEIYCHLHTHVFLLHFNENISREYLVASISFLKSKMC